MRMMAKPFPLVALPVSTLPILGDAALSLTFISVFPLDEKFHVEVVPQ